MADLPEDVLLGAWGAVGGSGAGDGVDVGYGAGAVRDRRANGGRTFDIEQGARHEGLYPGLGTLVEVEDGEPRGVSTDGVCAGSYGSAEGAGGRGEDD